MNPQKGDIYFSRKDGMKYKVEDFSYIDRSEFQESICHWKMAGLRCVDIPAVFYGYVRFLDMADHFDIRRVKL